ANRSPRPSANSLQPSPSSIDDGRLKGKSQPITAFCWAMNSTRAVRQRERSAPEPGRSEAGRQLSMRTRVPSIRPSAIQTASPAFSAPLKSMPMIRSGIDLLAEQFESSLERRVADRLPVAMEVMALDHRLASFALARKIDQTHRLGWRPAPWAGDSGYRQRHVGVG